jgi:outer membrane protein assembly factor BamD (BamD/ComL family)
MLSQRPYGRVFGALTLCLLALGAPARADTEDRATVVKAWRDLGRQVLSRWGTRRDPLPEWLNRALEGVDPNSPDAARIAESIVVKAVEAYGQNIIIVKGRIPLDVNPQCLLGLYAAQWFPSTRLGDWGRKQLCRCLEQTCLTAMPAVGGNWQARLEADLLAPDKAWDAPFQRGTFTEAEAPYLYCYLIENARSVEARNRARERLGHCLWEGYGLESGLRQYLTLLENNYQANDAWLQGAARLDRLGPHTLVKKLYEHRLTDANTMAEGREAGEGLAGTLLCESRYRQARAVLGRVSQRFGQVEWTTPEVKSFLRNFQENRGQTRQRFAGELGKATRELQAWQCCRLLDALWTPEEAPHEWQTLLQEAEPGTLAEQCSRVFLAGALLEVGQVEPAVGLVRGLAGSLNPFVQAQSLALAAQIAHVKGQEGESVRLYARALQMDRPTSLPDWAKDLVQALSGDAGAAGAALQMQRLLLQGYHHLKNGDYATAVDDLSQVAAHPQLPNALQHVLPCMMLLACLGVEDYTEAQTWGYRALEEYHKDHPEDSRIRDLLAKIQNLDLAVVQLITTAREEAVNPAVSLVGEQAISVCEAGVSLESCEPLAEAAGKGLQRLYLQACRHQDAQILTAECCYVRQHTVKRGDTEPSVSTEPLLFAAQVLRSESLERIQENFASLAEGEAVRDRMHRFAIFALKAKQMDLAASVLDARVSEQMSAADATILEDVADRYLAASNPQKAIDVFQKIAAKSQDPAKVQAMRLKVIDIYAETLKDGSQAIHQCEEFLRRYPESAQASQVEFLLGKLAYLNKDYSNATGQLDSFRKKYPKHPQVGQAMMLAGLSRMAEGNTQEAIERFKEVIGTHPEGDMAARSKFLIGYAQMSEQQYRAAIETFKQLVEQFPASQYVAQAQNLIDRLNKVSQ